MFWGLSMEGQKRYTQTVTESFHISQAVLDVTSVNQETTPTQIILEFENNDYILANLSKSAKIYQVPLDLNFQKGDRVSFRAHGPGIVHLTGYHVFDDDDLESRLMAGADSDEDDDDEEEMMENSISDDSTSAPPGKRKKITGGAVISKKSKLEDSDDEDDDDDEEDTLGSTLGESTLLDLEAEEDSDEDEEEEEEYEDEDDEEDDDSEEEADEEVKTSPKKAKGKKNITVNGDTPGKKEKVNTSKKESVKTSKSEVKTPKQSPNQSKKEKTPKQEGKAPKKEKQSPKDASTPTSGSKRVLEGGVIAEEQKVGEGPVAKSGKMVQVYYVGRLKSNNKQFDATTAGPGFKFRVGRGEVIRGWDIGVSGMRVGGKRRLTIPAGLAYGAKGSPPVIPPNATLVFDIELRGIS